MKLTNGTKVNAFKRSDYNIIISSCGHSKCKETWWKESRRTGQGMSTCDTEEKRNEEAGKTRKRQAGCDAMLPSYKSAWLQGLWTVPFYPFVVLINPLQGISFMFRI